MQCNSTNKTQFKIDIRTVKQEASYLLGLDVSVNLNMDTLFTVLKGVKRHFFDVGTALSILPLTTFIWGLCLLHNEAVTVLYYHECLSI